MYFLSPMTNLLNTSHEIFAIRHSFVYMQWHNLFINNDTLNIQVFIFFNSIIQYII